MYNLFLITSYSYNRNATHLEESELRRTLQSLACGPPGTRVLLKEPRGREVGDADRFLFNKDFTSKMYRIKINTIQVRL